MKAIVQDRYGGSEQLHLRDIEAPTPGEGEVLVRVRAAAIDQGTWHLMAGLPLLVRLGFGLRGPKDPTPARDLAGIVEAVGPGASGVAVGDEVLGIGRGALAELSVARAELLVPKPSTLGFAEAAALPISGLTALQAVRDVARVSEGQRVLVIGASGGVGSYAVQVALARGARVTGVASAAKADLVRDLGAEEVLDHRTSDVTARPELRGRFDAVIVTGGHTPVRRLRRLLVPSGTLVIVGAEGGGALLGGVHRQLLAGLASTLRRHRKAPFFFSAENQAGLADLVALVAGGSVRPALDRTYDLVDARAAMDHLRSGAARGKVAVTV